MRQFMLAISVGLGFTLVSTGLLARAEDTTTPATKTGELDTRCPWNPFAEAKEGDWLNVIATTESPSGKKKVSVTFRATKIEGDRVVVATDLKPAPATPPKERTYSRNDAPTVDGLFGPRNPGDKLSDVRIEDERKTVVFREFSCTKLGFTLTGTDSQTGASVTKHETIWISKDVTIMGLVAKRIETTSVKDGAETKTVTEAELASFGNGESVSWPTWEPTTQWIRQKFPGVRQVETKELATWLDDKTREQPLILDTRTTEEFEVSSLPGARFFAAKSTDDDIAKLKAEIDPKRPIVCYCAIGYRSSNMADRLAKAGFANVSNLEGAIYKWAGEGRPLVHDGKPADKVYTSITGRFQCLVGEKLRSDSPDHR